MLRRHNVCTMPGTRQGSEASPTPELLACLAEAGAAFRHAEVIVQQRLYNFLMAASILLLAGAAPIVTGPTPRTTLFMITASALGLFLSCAWTGLGFRQRTFVDLLAEIIQDLESRLPPELRVWKPIANLRAGKNVVFPVSKRKAQLPRHERMLRSSNLLFATPFVFGLAFLVLLCVALAQWMHA